MIPDTKGCTGPFFRWASEMRRNATAIPAADVRLGDRPGVGVSNPATWGPVAIHCSFDPPRPVIFKKWGEVFYGPTYAPHDRTEEADARLTEEADARLYRSAENPHPFSITFAFSQGAAKLSVHPHLGAVHPKLLETTARQALPAAVMADRQFCGMMHARMLKWADHYADAVVRFVIFHLLSEYKQCKNIAKEKLPGGNTDPDYCKTGFEVGCMSRLLFFKQVLHRGREHDGARL